MDWFSFAFGMLAAFGMAVLYQTGRAAERQELKRRLQDQEHREN